MKSILKKVAGLALAAALALGVSGCSSDGGTSSHKHTFAAEWSSDDATHWHAATCEHTEEVKDKAEHTWNDGEITKEPSITKEGEKTFTCTAEGCGQTKTESIAKLLPFNAYEQPIDVETNEVATAGFTYIIYFGVFPKTVLPSTSDVTVDETTSVTMGANTYYKGSDGNYYAKVKENCCGSSGYTYTDTTTVKQSSADSYRYFKVEPIKWKVLTKNYNDSGKALLLAEDILTANVPYYENCQNNRTIDGKTVYPNNYKHSQIRAYLNGLSYQGQSSEVTKWNGNGFLQTAFTATAQAWIADTEVDNRKETIDYDERYYLETYACENTTDKIFLLSESEVINTAYGFAAYNSYGQKNARIRVTTDYAKANYACQSNTESYGGMWWLRSPISTYDSRARGVSLNGNASGSTYVYDLNFGVVPALCISLQ